jgi:superfamily II DNA or RNA helicase
MNLYSYQERTVDLLLSPPEGVNRSLAVIATGGGKTIVFASLIDRMLRRGERALVIAHRKELLTQACEKIAHVAPSLHVELEQAENKASKVISGFAASMRGIDRSVVVASVQTLAGKRLQKWAPDTFSLIIVDEAHHSTSKAYRDIFEHFGSLRPGGTRLVGVTATPLRSDRVAMGHVFQEITVDYGIRELISLGHLCPVRARKITSEISLASVAMSHGDYVAADLERTVDVSERNELVVSAYEEHAPGDRAIVFTAGVNHAHHIAELFRSRGITARSVWGAMDKQARHEALSTYHTGETLVLTNFGVLTEGFDAPDTRCIILARPTKSSLIVTQMIGRGTRLAPGKDFCLVLDIRDATNGKNLCSAASLLGLSLKEQEEPEIKAEEETTPYEEETTVAVAFEAVKDAMQAEEIDLFGSLRPDAKMKSLSGLQWLKKGEESWVLRCENRKYTVRVDAMGRYAVARDGETIAVESTVESAFKLADHFIRTIHPDHSMFVEMNSKWRKEPASAKQLAYLSQKLKGKAFDKSISKGDAALLLASLEG